MSPTLLATKLHVPTCRPGLVTRGPLLERLHEQLDSRQLSLVSAPAGFGKTTLIAEWVETLDRPVAWLSLDNGDDDPARFLAYLTAALQGIEAGIGSSIQDLLHAQELPPVEPLVTELVNDIAAQATSFVLVLDDYHTITESTIHEAMGILLAHQPPQMHLVIATREDPPLPLPRLRARNVTTELRANDLRFTPPEAAVFLRQTMGLDLTPDEVATLESRTEGWAVGLQMAALAVRAHAARQEDRSGFIRRFSGDDRHVVDYLADEVLEHQPEDVHRFLLRTSILERFCGPLCDALLDLAPGRSQEILEQLERANLFVVALDNRRTWYRYHRLFGDLLRRWLDRSAQPGTAKNLHKRASRWYEEEGLIPEAVSHALASSDVEYATDLIAAHAADTWDQGNTALVHRWLDSLPENAVRTRPWLCVRRAWSARDSAALSRLWIEAAERAWAARLNRESITGRAAAAFAGDLAALRAMLGLLQGDDPGQVVEQTRQALEGADEIPRASRATLFLMQGLAHEALGNWRAALDAFAESARIGLSGSAIFSPPMAASGQARVACTLGEFRRAAEICREALATLIEPFEREGRLLPVAAFIHIPLGAVLLEQGDWAGAEKALAGGLELTKFLQHSDHVKQQGLAAMIRLRRQQGDVDGALALTQELEQIGSQARSQAGAYRAWLWLTESERAPGRLAAVAAWAEEHRLESNRVGPRLDVEQLVLARWLIDRRRERRRTVQDSGMQDLFRFLDRHLDAAEENEWRWNTIRLLALKAMAIQSQGDADRALSTLERALVLAGPERIVLAFLEEGAPMAHLVRRAKEREAAPDYAARLLALFAESQRKWLALPDHPGAQAQLIEPLTTREMEILQLLARGLSNREIAQALVISLPTVKRHVTNIHGKLGVRNRTQAVVTAQDLGILADEKG